jgi:multiple sugar transport system permease protein
MGRKNVAFKYWLIAPAVLIMIGVLVFPLIYSLRTSLYYYYLTKPNYRPFYWFNNYKEMFNKQMLNSVWVTLKFSITSVAIQLIFGFIIAYCLSRIQKLRDFFTSILMAPMMVTPIAVGLIWRLLLHPDLGIVNYLISKIGLTTQPWLGQESTALLTLVLIDAWQWTPFLMILIYAGMLSLPIEVYEAAMIDGANEFKKVTNITIPMLKNILIIATTIRFIDALRAYDLVYMMTRGGPGTSTETLSYYIFRVAFTNTNFGQAAALSITYVVVLSLLTSFLFKQLNREH